MYNEEADEWGRRVLDAEAEVNIPDGLTPALIRKLPDKHLEIALLRSHPKVKLRPTIRIISKEPAESVVDKWRAGFTWHYWGLPVVEQDWDRSRRRKDIVLAQYERLMNEDARAEKQAHRDQIKELIEKEIARRRDKDATLKAYPGIPSGATKKDKDFWWLPSLPKGASKNK